MIIDTASQPDPAEAADLDGDGDLDVIYASRQDGVFWYANDGAGNFGAPRTVNASEISVYSVQAADLDGDGDLDVLYDSASMDRVSWHENLDGAGAFGPRLTIGAANKPSPPLRTAQS